MSTRQHLLVRLYPLALLGGVALVLILPLSLAALLEPSFAVWLDRSAVPGILMVPVAFTGFICWFYSLWLLAHGIPGVGGSRPLQFVIVLFLGPVGAILFVLWAGRKLPVGEEPDA